MNKHLIKINKKIVNIKIVNKAISIEGAYGIEIIKLYSDILFVKKEKDILYFSNYFAHNNTKIKKNIQVYLKFKELYERIKGLSKGYKRQLIIMGVGFKMFIGKNNTLILKLGRSHNNHIYIPKSLEITSPKINTILISGNSKDNVHGMSEVIKSCRKPYVYTKKGIKNYGDIIVTKVGKKS
jgi:large subunit ribosomal protein L6